MAAFECVLITAPDRLARNYVHQMLLVDELTQRGCRVECVERPMSDDPHDQLLVTTQVGKGPAAIGLYGISDGLKDILGMLTGGGDISATTTEALGTLERAKPT